MVYQVNKMQGVYFSIFSMKEAFNKNKLVLTIILITHINRHHSRFYHLPLT